MDIKLLGTGSLLKLLKDLFNEHETCVYLSLVLCILLLERLKLLLQYSELIVSTSEILIDLDKSLGMTTDRRLS